MTKHLGETTFGDLAKFGVVRSFAGHDEASVTVARVKPNRGGRGRAARTVEMNARAQFDDGRTLGKLRRMFVVNANERNAQVWFH